MKCSEFEEKIYLYDELSTAEKTAIQLHRSKCDTCNAFAEQVILSLTLIRKANTVEAVAKNPHLLTQRIMKSVTQDKLSLLDRLVMYLDSLFIRYAFTATSLLLVFFLLYEHQTVEQSAGTGLVKNEARQGLVLDMNLFLKSYQNQRVSSKQAPISRYAYYKSTQSVKPFNQ